MTDIGEKTELLQDLSLSLQLSYMLFIANMAREHPQRAALDFHKKVSSESFYREDKEMFNNYTTMDVHE